MKQFEYKTGRVSNEEELNVLGGEGWELVAVSVAHGVERFFLKREVEAKKAKKDK